MPDTPQYCIDLLLLLRNLNMEVGYYIEEFSDEILFDCFVVDGFVIKLDRLPQEVLPISDNDFTKLVGAFLDIHEQLKQEAKKLGWEL